MDGGASLLLWGDGRGGWRPAAPSESGLLVSQDAKSLVTTDINDDGRPDFLVGVNDGALLGFVQQATPTNPATNIVQVTLSADKDTAAIVGAQVRLRQGDVTQLRETAAGSGYLSQSSATLFFAVPQETPSDPLHFLVRWADGTTSDQSFEHANTVSLTRIKIAQP